MPLELTKKSLLAELASVERLLEEARSINDIVGINQYEHRVAEIKEKLKEIDKKVNKRASVALFFAGEPVFGSRGIMAEFAGIILKEFNDIINRVQAVEVLGELGSRGKIPEVGESNLMITQITRGSFGFVLDELTNQQPMFETPLKRTVDIVSNIIEKTASVDDSEFEKILPDLDGRSLISLRNFFKIMHKRKANLRVVEGKKDFFLDEKAIHRALIRTESTSIKEETTLIEGILLGFLPEHKKFEFRTTNNELIYGSVSKDAVEQYYSYIKQGITPINMNWVIKVDERLIKPLNRKEKVVYRLISFDEQYSKNA